jgi:MarR family transcriptional regulator for hemolysin
MKPVHETLGHQIAAAHRTLHSELDARMRGRGADFTTWKALAHLLDGEPPSQRELAARMLIDPATLVRHLDRLESDGLVERERDEHDRRVVRVVITASGRTMHRTLQRVAEQLDGELAALLSPDEYERMRKALHRITEHFAPEPFEGAAR